MILNLSLLWRATLNQILFYFELPILFLPKRGMTLTSYAEVISICINRNNFKKHADNK